MHCSASLNIMSSDTDPDMPELLSRSESESGSGTESTAASASGYNDPPCVFCLTPREYVWLAFGFSYEHWLSVNATSTYSFLFNAVMNIHRLLGCGAGALWPIGLILASYRGIN